MKTLHFRRVRVGILKMVREVEFLTVAIFAVLSLLETPSAQIATQPARAILTFEVASVKVQPPPSRTSDALQDSLARIQYMTFRGDRFRAANATAAWLIREAYGHDFRLREQVLKKPAWLDQDRFEIDAVARNVKPSGIDSAPPDAVLEMLRSLLQTRFKLRVRPETRDGPVYALVRARGDGRLGAGIRVSEVDCTEPVEERNGERFLKRECIPQFGGDRYRRAQTMERFVQWLEGRVGRLVINESGLSGPIDLDVPSSVALEFTALARVGTESGLFTTLTEVLGLKLESRRAPIPVLVVEHVERPTGN